MGDPLFVSVNRALEVTNIGRTKFFELLAQNKIESVRLGRRRLIPWVALLSFCEQLREEARAGAGIDIA